MARGLRRILVDFADGLAILGLELLFFQRIAPLRRLLRLALARRLARLAPHFDGDLYVRQIGARLRRARAARDPLVHYAIIGWREFRSPNRRFDPRFYREDIGCGRIVGEPLAHYLAHHAEDGLPQNEVEAARPEAIPPSERPTALVIHHARGGGSSQYLSLFEADLQRQGIVPIRLRLVPRSDRLVVWGDGEHRHRLFDITTDRVALTLAARAAKVCRIVVSHIIDIDPAVLPLVEGMAQALGIPFHVILHDYFSLCARVNLIDGAGRPCPIPPSADCVRCVAGGGGEIGRADPLTWRDTVTGFASRAERVFVPSHDAERRLRPFIARPIEAWLPESDDDRPPLRPRGKLEGGILRIVVLGSLNVIKGSEVLLDLARRVRERGAPMRLGVVGEAVNTPALRAEGVSVSGRYRLGEVRGLIEAAAADVVFLPAICPETWSFVLSVALDMGLPVVAFAHGAPFERLTRLGRTDLILPLSIMDRPDAVFDAFARLHRSWEDAPATARARPPAQAEGVSA